MNISICNNTVTLKYSFRAMMIYEKITGESFNPKGVTEIMIYFYSTILASDKNIALTFEQFLEWIDDNPNALNDFSTWLTTILTKNGVIADKSANNNPDEGTKKNL